MKKLKKIFTVMITIFMTLILAFSNKVFADNSVFQLKEYSKQYKDWLELSDEEKQNTIMPRMYDVENSEVVSKNPLFVSRMQKASLSTKFNLQDLIPSNIVIRNQKHTNSCWAFATISSLETNMALSNYKSGTNLSKVYDFSERHMEYATSNVFLNNETNKMGYNRKVGSGGSYVLATSYLTNSSGAIPESEMKFEDNEDIIDINQIRNKTISSQVYDTVEIANYMNQSGKIDTEMMDKVKQHIQDYGAVYAAIHAGALSGINCYNNDTGAQYCNNSILHKANHAVSIIGWDDNYDTSNFVETMRPKSKGAWIARNSYGERIEYNLNELKSEFFNSFKQQCIANGWNSAEEIPNSVFESSGFTIENDIAYMKYGDNGLIYISYEDVNVSTQMFGITKAKDEVNYDYIYQYDKLYPAMRVNIKGSKVMLCNLFDKQTSATEYLTQVSLYVDGTNTCKVYVNPNGTSKDKESMQLVQLKSGESQTLETGYHTLEFAKAIPIKASQFAVVIEIQGNTNNLSIPVESKVNTSQVQNPVWDTVEVENGKCFIASGNNLSNCDWKDMGTLSKEGSIDGNSTIKAFTTKELVDGSLKNIEITTQPAKTSYFEGENFDKTGMVVRANYNSKTKPYEILKDSNYTIKNGTNLKAGQTSVTIEYEDQSVTQAIKVEKNSVVELKIKTPPTKTEYKEGHDFDNTGMVVEATYKDGTTKIVTDYTINNGKNLKADQTEITISCGEKTVSQKITVTPNPLIEISITKAPNKTKYVVGQDFDKTGMIVTGTFQDKTTQEITEYTIENGTKLSKSQTFVIIKYEGKLVNQEITVEEKTIFSIQLESKPSKLNYIQNKDNLDLNGGKIKVTYNDNSTETIDLTSKEISISGFNNSNLGKQRITVTYQNKSTQFEIEVVEEETAKNSNFDNISCNVEKTQAYYFTNDSSKDYTLISVKINKINRNLTNDKIEYYYYLSQNKNEKNINDWVKINEEQNSKDSLQFTIDSRKISNYNDLANKNTLYLYIKEVAVKGGNQSIKISNAMKLETDIKLEMFLDNVKKDNSNSSTAGNNNQNSNNNNLKNENKTSIPDKLPKTGIKDIIIFIILVISAIGIIVFIRYKNLSKYIK